MGYIKIPKEISFRELTANTSFSSLNYAKVLGRNANIKPLRELMCRELATSDKGVEVGSQNYTRKSDFYFIRTKSLQPEYLSPLLTSESVKPIIPSAFVKVALNKGDILISKDSNIGETVILDKDYPNHTLSGGIYNLPILEKRRYVFAFLKSDFFKTQLNFLASKGSTIRHAKTLFLDCVIPFPNGKDKDRVVGYVETLVTLLTQKEIAIRQRYDRIMAIIKEELISNQKTGRFAFHYPRIEEIRSMNRINAGIYSEYFKENEFTIRNYKRGHKSIKDLGFGISRGQNLQVSAIGKSIYSDVRKKGFYTLILPKNISLFGTVKKYEYLGSQQKLKTLKSGDIIFGAEGFEKGRSIVIFEDSENAITNIHGITLNHYENDLTLSIFIKCFLDYLRSVGLIDLYAAGGNGGSLAKHYWGVIPFPSFPESKQKEIAGIYSRPVRRTAVVADRATAEEDGWNLKAGVVQIDASYKKIKSHLAEVLARIIDDRPIEIDFSFLETCERIG